jgi:hypothetical protein
VRETIIRQNVQPVTNVNFSVSVGAVIPATGVTLHRLPPAVIEIVPQYRDYEFVLVGTRIIIVEPRTRKIVYIVEG